MSTNQKNLDTEKRQIAGYTSALTQVQNANISVSDFSRDLLNANISSKELSKKYVKIIKNKQNKQYSLKSLEGQLNLAREGLMLISAIPIQDVKKIEAERKEKVIEKKIASKKKEPVLVKKADNTVVIQKGNRESKLSTITEKAKKSQTIKSKSRELRINNNLMNVFKRIVDLKQWSTSFPSIIPNVRFGLKNAWDLKGGVSGKSYNEVRLNLKYRLFDKFNVLIYDGWNKIGSGISLTDSIEVLYEKVWNKLLQWIESMMLKDSITIEFKRVDVETVRMVK